MTAPPFPTPYDIAPLPEYPATVTPALWLATLILGGFLWAAMRLARKKRQSREPFSGKELAVQELKSLKPDRSGSPERLSLILRRYAESICPEIPFAALTPQELRSMLPTLPSSLHDLIQITVTLDERAYQRGETSSEATKTAQVKALKVLNAT